MLYACEDGTVKLGDFGIRYVVISYSSWRSTIGVARFCSRPWNVQKL